MKLNVTLFFAAAIALAGCVEIPDYDVVPKIYYNGISQYTTYDSLGQKDEEVVTLTIDFEDGDGDLGASPEERSDSITFKDWGNYELVTMVKNTDGTWTESIRSEDRYKFMPDLRPDRKVGPIKGKLDLNTKFAYSRSSVMTTMKFKVRIRDRALHVSNQTPESDTVVVPSFR